MNESASISPEAALARQRAGSLIIDVRDRDEWDEEHVAGAMLIPLESLPERIDEIPRNRDLIVMCRSGKRSAKAQAILAEASLPAANLEGGILAWREAGLPVAN